MNIDCKIRKYTEKLNHYLKLKQKGGSSLKLGDRVKAIDSTYSQVHAPENTEENTQRKEQFLAYIKDVVGTIKEMYADDRSARVDFDNGALGLFMLTDLVPATQEAVIQLKQPQVSTISMNIQKTIKININEKISLKSLKEKYNLNDQKYTFFYRKNPFPVIPITDEQIITGPAEVTIIDDNVVYIRE